MNMNPNAHALQNLNELIAAGKIVEAFEKYYDDNVVMQENDNPPMLGKAGNRQREQELPTTLPNGAAPAYWTTPLATMFPMYPGNSTSPIVGGVHGSSPR